MGPPPFISKFDLVSESPVIQPLAPQGLVWILSTRHFYEKGKERQKIEKNALKQHFWGIDFPQVELSYECHYAPHRIPKTQTQWEPVETKHLLGFYSFHYTLFYSGSYKPRVAMWVVGHSLCLLIRSHCSIIRLHQHTAHFARILCCAHYFAHSPPSSWESVWFDNLWEISYVWTHIIWIQRL